MLTEEIPQIEERLSWVHCEDEELQPLMRQYFFAKRIWPDRDNPTPSSNPSHPKTWGDVFEKHYGTNLDEYAKWAKEHDIKGKIEAYRAENQKM